MNFRNGSEWRKMRDHYKKFCSKCKYKDVDEHDPPCKECANAFFDDWNNPKRKFGKYFERRGKKKGDKE